jgi:hypothetical protein
MKKSVGTFMLVVSACKGYIELYLLFPHRFMQYLKY